jgi:hypothetical protein
VDASIETSHTALRRSTGSRSTRVFQIESDGKIVQADPGTGASARTGIALAGAAGSSTVPTTATSDTIRPTGAVSAIVGIELNGGADRCSATDRAGGRI